jgi:hypothetical protein
MTTTDQLRKDINKLNDKIEKLERKNDNYEKQLNERTIKGKVERKTIATCIIETQKQISAIHSQIAEKDALITLIAKREITALEVQRAQATAEKEKEKEGGTIVLLFFFSFFYTHVCF